jgi:hypothetical protein
VRAEGTRGEPWRELRMACGTWRRWRGRQRPRMPGEQRAFGPVPGEGRWRHSSGEWHIQRKMVSGSRWAVEAGSGSNWVEFGCWDA